jgi:hypothetical protein
MLGHRRSYLTLGTIRAMIAWVPMMAAQSAEISLPAGSAVEFDRDIRPILMSRCFDCHDSQTQQSQLRLDDVTGILRGGDSGEPLFVSGSSSDSLIIQRITAENSPERMPPEGDRVTAEQVNLLRAWIDAGASMPGKQAAQDSLKPRTDHWSFQPVKRPAVPSRGDAFAANAIDDFVLARLKAKHLEPSAPANRLTLIRRLYLVMHGLPPTPQEVADFVDDTESDAYARLVDRVLASPHSGERWAGHWMDVVRYADTNGYETNKERKTAYHYRDYIIESFNADKPYDQFIREQLAGDALGAEAATGFLVAGAYDVVMGPDINLKLAQRQDVLADMISTTGTAFLGLTVGCARCHNHKFDPILQRDYYSMQAIFAGTKHAERPFRKTADAWTIRELAKLTETEKTATRLLETYQQKGAIASASDVANTVRAPINARLNEEKFHTVQTDTVRFKITASSSSEPAVDELEIYDDNGRNVALASCGAVVSASGTLSGHAIHKLECVNDGSVGNDHSWISDTPGTGYVQVVLPTKTTINRIVWGRDRTGRFTDRVPTEYQFEIAIEPGKWLTVASSNDHAPSPDSTDTQAFLNKLSAADATAAITLQQDLRTLQSRISALTQMEKGWLGTFAQPDKTHRLYRGEPLQKREVVTPDALSVLGTLGLSVDEPEQRRRRRLAEWISSPRHPLTARVMVNRVWYYLLGHGIVDTPSDFGINGSRPTHPELLDWLADEFVKRGWSIQHIQRLILLSSTFQQDSTPQEESLALDAAGRFFWRYTPRRLEAEAIRDSILSVSGSLDSKMGGPGFYLMDVVVENVMHYFPKVDYTSAECRRMVYLFRIRQATDSVFSSFDCPDGGQVMPKRSRSTTPLQALNLFNSTFTLQQAEILAARLRHSAGETPDAQVVLAFALFFSRSPDADERDVSVTLIRNHGIESFCRAMFNASEFLFIF